MSGAGERGDGYPAVMLVGRGDRLYWNPVPHIDAALRLQQAADPQWSGGLVLGGTWEDRNWRNVPGPLYGAMTDNCWVGRLAPG
jgi:hypothetical protein